MQNRNYDLRVNAVYEVPEFRPSDGVLRPSRMKALLVYLIVAAGLLGISLVSSALEAIFPNMGIWPMQIITGIIYYGLMCAGPVVLLLLLRGRGGFAALRPNPLRFGTAALAAALALLGVFFANNLNVLWSLPFDAAGFDIYVSSMPSPESMGQLLLAIFAVGVLPGLCEELVFRGYMQPAFEERGSKRAVIFVSLLFALLHGSVVGFPAQFILGLIMAALVIITNSIYAGAIFHTVYNSALMLLLYMQHQMGISGSAPGMLFKDLGAFGVISAMLGVAQMGAAIFFILFAMYRRAKRKGIQLIEKQPMRLRGGEIALLCGALCHVALYYLLDVLAMAGVIV